MTESKIRVHLIISGRVQGVGYRYFIQKHANDLALSGWVQNQEDGSVEAEFEGPSNAVEKMIQFCREGPSHAKVEEIKKESVPVKDEGIFRVKQ